ncbi:MAG: TauD/TfdA family dioxygenase [Burkholderiaceae bacterium]|nr:TauD/TfdA family dioxygenase [Burkholderiaceae bacterium]MDP1968997.1 TauD/TfdA family dioxygenase [Burkholderiaceae bacterium]
MKSTFEPIHTRAGWLATDIKGKQDLSFELTPKHLRAIDLLMEQVHAKNLALGEIERRHFSHPDLDADLAGLLQELESGRGVVVVKGFPVERYSLPDIEKIYWGVGTHFGRGHSQSAAGDIMGHVANTPEPDGRQSARGYLSNRELWLHTDFSIIIGLLCVRSAQRGGDSVVVSGETLYNTLLKERPEFMPIYFKGFPYHRRGEAAPDAEPVTPYDVPIFSLRDGFLSCCYTRRIIEPGLRELGREFTPEEKAALDCLDEVTRRPQVRLTMTLEPGEAMFLNNLTMLHARTDFVDWDDERRKRLMLRLWLEPDKPRPHVPEIHLYRNKNGRPGIEAQEGRRPAAAQYLLS